MVEMDRVEKKDFQKSRNSFEAVLCDQKLSDGETMLLILDALIACESSLETYAVIYLIEKIRNDIFRKLKTVYQRIYDFTEVFEMPGKG
jgi:hypothetical protein